MSETVTLWMCPDNNARVRSQGQASLCYSVVTNSDIIIPMIYNATLGGATLSDFIGYVLNYANSSSLVSENFWNSAYYKKDLPPPLWFIQWQI